MSVCIQLYLDKEFIYCLYTVILFINGIVTIICSIQMFDYGADLRRIEGTKWSTNKWKNKYDFKGQVVKMYIESQNNRTLTCKRLDGEIVK